MHDVTGMSIASLQEAMARGETSAEEIAAAFLARIREKDDAVGAYLTVTEEEALAQARAVDARRARGLPGGGARGHPGRLQRQPLHAGGAHNLRLEAAGRLPSAL